MMQRVFGVFAALVLVGGSAACSSSSTPATQTPADSGTTDTGKDSAPPADTGKDVAETAPVCGTDIDCTVGTACTSTAQCDVTGAGINMCFNSGALGPINPTGFCIGYDQNGDYPGCGGTKTDTNGNPAELKGCDGDKGLCWEYPNTTTKAPGTWECDAPCDTDATGKFTTTCQGKDACTFQTAANDSSGKFAGMVGTCGSGCSTNTDCPTGSVCDPMWKACLSVKCGANPATPDKECTDLSAKLSSPLGPAWKCDVTAGSPTQGFCGFHYPKNPGDVCDPTKTGDAEECWCIADTGATSAFCSQSCKIGSASDCPTGFTCDSLFNATDSSGAALFPSGFALPNGTAGYCMKDCMADSDCGAGQKCTAHGGMTQKTCL